MKEREPGYTRIIHEVEYLDGSIHTQMSQVNRWDLDTYDAVEMMIGVLVAGGYGERMVRRAMQNVETVEDDKVDDGDGVYGEIE